MCRCQVRVELRELGNCKGNIGACVDSQMMERSGEALIELHIAHTVAGLRKRERGRRIEVLIWLSSGRSRLEDGRCMRSD